MKLYKLSPIEDLQDDNPWRPWFDKCFGIVVRAENELQARRLAASKAGDESSDCKDGNPWLYAKYSKCEIIEQNGDSEIILIDFASA